MVVYLKYHIPSSYIGHCYRWLFFVPAIYGYFKLESGRNFIHYLARVLQFNAVPTFLTNVMI